MQLEQRRQAMLQLHLSDQQFNCPLSAPYIRDLMGYHMSMLCIYAVIYLYCIIYSLITLLT